MNKILYLLGHINNLPAKLKGLKIGKNSFLGPGYDFFFVQLKNIVIGDNIQIGRDAWLQTVKNGK